MRIFVTGTGRCGSVTFSKACRHVANYTCGHETHTNKPRDKVPKDEAGWAGALYAEVRLAGDIANWDYPDGHIEVSPQLVLGIPILRKRYPAAKWVHLVRRDRDACAASLARWSDMRAFGGYWFLNYRADKLSVAYVVYDTILGLCESLLPDAFTLELERAQEQWPACWDFMGAAGDLAASARQWTRRYNASRP